MRRRLAVLPFAVSALLLAGCSSSSRLSLTIDSILGASEGNVDSNYINADLMGKASSACGLLAEDTAKVTLSLHQPGSIGPTFGAHLKSYEIDYYYYDPADGSLKGPVADLKLASGDVRDQLGASTDVVIPIVPWRLKVWSVGITCHGLAGFTGARRITRMAAKVTMHAEDDTGKSLSAAGNIAIYLEDFASPAPGASDPCVGQTIPQYLQSICDLED